MDDRTIRFGTDLRLLDNLLQQNDRERGCDLETITRRVPGSEPQVDLETVSAVENLQQALLLRFLTPTGELAMLGHPDYGSRLFELIGERNNDSTRNRAKLYVLQALLAEPRVKEVRSVRVTQSARDRTEMDIEVQLLAIDSNTPLNFVFPFYLEGGLGP